jgi:hypothetical protein
MIKISIDEAAAFDMLAILELKKASNYAKFAQEIIDEIGLNLYNIILKSDIYQQLVLANLEVFNYVDKMNANEELSALMVHRANMFRYTAKKELQRQFFGTHLVERKV